MQLSEHGNVRPTSKPTNAANSGSRASLRSSAKLGLRSDVYETNSGSRTSLRSSAKLGSSADMCGTAVRGIARTGATFTLTHYSR